MQKTNNRDLGTCLGGLGMSRKNRKERYKEEGQPEEKKEWEWK